MSQFRFRAFSLIVPTALTLGAALQPAVLEYPATKTVDVTTTYFRTKVPDPYRWLENGQDPSVRTWARGADKAVPVGS